MTYDRERGEAPFLVCEGLTKSYGGFYALSGVNLVLPRGRIVALLGPNGSGKTTLIKLVTGLLTPTAGAVRILGHAPGTETAGLVSYLPERNSIPEWMTVREAMDFFSDFFPDFEPERAGRMLAELGVPEDRRIRHLSKGMKEKVQLVLVMSRRARLYVLDEPISGVDPAARDYILETVVANRDPDATILVSTHLIADIEQIIDDFVLLHAGQVIRYDSRANLLRDEGKSVDALFREVFRC